MPEIAVLGIMSEMNLQLVTTQVLSPMLMNGHVVYSTNVMPQKTQLEDLKVLHRVAYNRPGSGIEIKKNLRKFNGFSYTKDDKKYQSKVMTVER